MNTAQAWLIVGVPALAITAAMFIGRSLIRSAAGYLILAVTFVFFLIVVEDMVSAGAIGAVGFLLVARGRGSEQVELEDEHEEVPMRVGDPEVAETRHV